MATPPDEVEVSRPDKLLWASMDVTKRRYVDYLDAVSEHMLPWVRQRPLTLVRAPDGVGGKQYFQKAVPTYAPRVDPDGAHRGAQRRTGRRLRGL